MALVVTAPTLGGTSGHEGTAVSVAAGACTLNITDAADQTLYIAFTFDDQGTTSRTVTVTYNGVAMTGRVQMKSESLSGQWAAVDYLKNPDTGSAFDILISSSPAFNNRQWRVIAVVANGNDQTTPFDSVQLNESATATSTSNTVSSAAGDIVLSFGALDGRTVASAGSTEGAVPDLGEFNTGGGVYLGAEDYAGDTSVSTGYNWGGAAIIAAEIAFNLNAAGSGATPAGLLIAPPGFA